MLRQKARELVIILSPNPGAGIDEHDALAFALRTKKRCGQRKAVACCEHESVCGNAGHSLRLHYCSTTAWPWFWLDQKKNLTSFAYNQNQATAKPWLNITRRDRQNKARASTRIAQTKSVWKQRRLRIVRQVFLLALHGFY